MMTSLHLTIEALQVTGGVWPALLILIYDGQARLTNNISSTIGFCLFVGKPDSAVLVKKIQVNICGVKIDIKLLVARMARKIGSIAQHDNY